MVIELKVDGAPLETVAEFQIGLQGFRPPSAAFFFLVKFQFVPIE